MIHSIYSGVLFHEGSRVPEGFNKFTLYTEHYFMKVGKSQKCSIITLYYFMKGVKSEKGSEIGSQVLARLLHPAYIGIWCFFFL